MKADLQQPQGSPEFRTDFFTTSDGVRLHYLSAGSGSAIVFVPGWTMPAWIWENQLRYFANKYQAVALDPRSQGESELTGEGLYFGRKAQDILELVEHLHLAPVVLVGWSEGVAPVLSYVEQFGTETIRALAILDCEFRVTEGERRELERYLHTFIREREAVTERFVRDIFSTPQREEYFQKLIAASLRMPTASAVILQLECLSREPEWDMAHILVGFDRPLLYVASKNWEPYAHETKMIVPSARVELFPNARHALFVDEAERFNSVLEQWLEESA